MLASVYKPTRSRHFQRVEVPEGFLALELFCEDELLLIPNLIFVTHLLSGKGQNLILHEETV